MPGPIGNRPPLLPPATALHRVLTLLAAVAAVVTFNGCETMEPEREPRTVVENSTQRPGRVLVYDYAAAVEDVPTDAALGARLSGRSSIPVDQLALDRQLGAQMSAQLIQLVRGWGLPAERALPNASLQVNDVVIRGYFVSIHTNNSGSYFSVGMDPNAREFMTAIENFHVTAQGTARSLGSGFKTSGEKVLAAATGSDSNPAGYIGTNPIRSMSPSDRAKVGDWARQSVTEGAERLRERFKEQGWIP